MPDGSGSPPGASSRRRSRSSPDAREAVESAFAAPIANVWGTSEAGVMASGCWRGIGMHLCDDLVIIEPIDRSGKPVPPGTRSDRILLTAIANPTLPPIRYEITDETTVLTEPCACGSAHRRIADVEGRLDDVFGYPRGVVAHPHVFRSALLREHGLVEYQVRQTKRGADILAVGSVDPVVTARAIEAKLAGLGLSDPKVTLTIVDRLERQAIGKLRRFVPLTTTQQNDVAW